MFRQNSASAVNLKILHIRNNIRQLKNAPKLSLPTYCCANDNLQQQRQARRQTQNIYDDGDSNSEQGDQGASALSFNHRAISVSAAPDFGCCSIEEE